MNESKLVLIHHHYCLPFPQIPWAGALLVDEEGGSVLALGGDLNAVRGVARDIEGESTRRIVEVHIHDLNGAFMMPVRLQSRGVATEHSYCTSIGIQAPHGSICPITRPCHQIIIWSLQVLSNLAKSCFGW